jgi:hypothetical protein
MCRHVPDPGCMFALRVALCCPLCIVRSVKARVWRLVGSAIEETGGSG